MRCCIVFRKRLNYFRATIICWRSSCFLRLAQYLAHDLLGIIRITCQFPITAISKFLTYEKVAHISYAHTVTPNDFSMTKTCFSQLIFLVENALTLSTNDWTTLL
ncbi:hypothetical protein PsorP6_012129 [Peronosclerospora sorghi]|uniref:Uncharacterized protein n=1 Tax=Peronosclerospora sorghi TaxID=230839 RepID=A0ACC0WJY9_9STRA|nr:hypothetical protein PsorP6_012129 [Peronosclerospora sorghi]